jgi:WD repeat and SOF domain-containing protein 1
MKVRLLSRQESEYTRERARDIFRIHHNPIPYIHPFERAREYKRALNAVKLERLQSKPFLGSFEPGHGDGVYALAKHPHHLSTMASASADGDIHLWCLSTRRSRCYLKNAHEGFIHGVCFGNLTETRLEEPLLLLSAGHDQTVKLWSFQPRKYMNSKTSLSEEDGESSLSTMSEEAYELKDEQPICYKNRETIYGIDHHRNTSLFVISTSVIEVWDEHRTLKPLHVYSWGVDTIQTVRYNPIETSILAAAASDRSILFYDIRTNSCLKKMILDSRTNNLCWNPMEAYCFSTANEDHQVYTFDMRYLEHGALNIMKDHVSAVLDIDYSPTGQELVTGSYDKSIRIFKIQEGHSRDIYHTKRMQRVYKVKFSMDGNFIVSASDDMNLRLWKSKSWEKLGPLSFRERNHLNYNEQLKQHFSHVPELKRIARHRHIPKSIYTASKLKRTMLDAESIRLENQRKHKKQDPSQLPPNERKKHLLNLIS